MPTPALQVCQPGFDVRKCPDWAYLFNSDWPSLAIVFETTVTVLAGNTGQIISHNLGFFPLTSAWVNSSTISYARLPQSLITVDQNNIVILFDPALTNIASATITVRCYNVNISKEASYPLPQSAEAQLSYNDKFGIKFAKTNRSISSKNLNDFIIHSRAQSPAVLTIATEKGKYFNSAFADPGTGTTAPCIVYPLKTAYIPWIFGAIKFNDGTYRYHSIHNLTYIAATNTLVLNIGISGKGSLVILRDPLFYPNTIRIVY